ncbi:MAG: hypothetical protein ACD_16C00099G0013 [uncultured bacterium]|nr:MAG: hypothetical protein ACD_16C00099G0013 [uncultured bacterium]OFW68146.1 MAG: hypothetical protein A2X70_05555 [Alphaproteobacteria bacterium GWC2_42_16]OFW73539.1 MAG: hypothetical protein A2Z80_06855 [Alphaproteobacteria bacterium GWA2_41_27]OFW82388.1 MAG: hypothetical protein A3E50_04255 [Alphaproteobacteria bacterium RIFCSPHIGHO2_12_FULL_42_100]OFW86214.1 MAG: hypothetical protein A2W06_01185 [Alphaproteobacteria bacterium RBG_16_42_14]OFW91772.1 MAG: hypothetical protein A3C41_012
MKKYDFSLLRRIFGYLFLLIGVFSLFLPILQGWFFIILALVLLKNEPWERKIRSWIHDKYPETKAHFRKFHQKLDQWVGKWWRH